MDRIAARRALLGVKTVLNELIAYSQMKDLLAADPGYLSPRARLLATYACAASQTLHRSESRWVGSRRWRQLDAAIFLTSGYLQWSAERSLP